MEMGLVLSRYSLSKQLVVRDSVQMQMYWPSVTLCQRYSTHHCDRRACMHMKKAYMKAL